LCHYNPCNRTLLYMSARESWCEDCLVWGGLSISFHIHLVLYVFRGIYHTRTIPLKQWEVHVNKLRRYSMTAEDWKWIRPEGVIDFEIFFPSKQIAPTTKKTVYNSKGCGRITITEYLTTVSIPFRVYMQWRHEGVQAIKLYDQFILQLTSKMTWTTVCNSPSHLTFTWRILYTPFKNLKDNVRLCKHKRSEENMYDASDNTLNAFQMPKKAAVITASGITNSSIAGS